MKRFSLIVLALGAIAVASVRVSAQDNNSPWTPAVNVSQSGAASRPLITTAPDGTLSAVWWDATEGELYARTAITSTTWTTPSRVPAIVGSRTVDSTTGREVLVPPRDVRLAANSRGSVYAFWYDITGQLLTAVNVGGDWNAATPLADAVLTFDATPDISGTLHLAYIKSSSAAGTPAGIYYRAAQGTQIGSNVEVYGSAYFRTLTPADAHVSTAGDSADRVLVAWDDPQSGQSAYARSTDGGATWSEPQIISTTLSGHAQHVLMISPAVNEFLMMWQDAATGACGFVQRHSIDGGETWSDPVRVLNGLTRCNAQWAVMNSDSQLWLISRAPATEQSPSFTSATVAAWDGAQWSEPKDITLSFFDTTNNRSIALNCINIAVAGQTAGLIGCDPIGDVWAARNTIDIATLVSSIKPVWRPIQDLSGRTGAIAAPADVPDLATDTQGGLYAVWSQTDAPEQSPLLGVNDTPGSGLYAATFQNGRWTNGTKINTGPTNQTNKAEQASLAADDKDRLHVVYSGGTEGEIYHTWTYERDVGVTQSWSEPIAVSTPGALCRWPDIVADPRGDTLYVIYAQPFNEGRGIYLARSTDGGTTWASAPIVDAAAAKWDSADKPRLALDTTGHVLHAVWLRTALPGSLASKAVYYARSLDNGQTWSEPLKIAEGAVDWPRLIVPAAGEVIVTWNQALGLTVGTWPSVWTQWSNDSGERWTEATSIRGFDRVTGPIGLATNGAGQVYITGIAQGTGGESVLLSALWLGQDWSDVETFGVGQIAARGNAVSLAIAATTQRLSALLHLNTLGANGTFAFQTSITDRQVDVSAQVTPAPTFTPLPIVTLDPTATPRPSPTPIPTLTIKELAPPTSRSSPPPLIIGGALAAVIVVGGVIFALARRRR